MVGVSEAADGYSLSIDDNRLVVNNELVIELRVSDDLDSASVVIPTESEWLDDGAYLLYDDEESVGIEVFTGVRGGEGDGE